MRNGIRKERPEGAEGASADQRARRARNPRASNAQGAGLPTESEEQMMLFLWAGYMRCDIPELRLMYHIPNEGKRSMATGGRMRAEGLKKGVPDICLPVARGPHHALYIELKRAKGGRVSEEQKAWIDDLAAEGNLACVCHGWDDARKVILRYLGREERD